jgi:hypothetical protein
LDERIVEWKRKRYGWMDEWTDGLMDELVDGCMEG